MKNYEGILQIKKLKEMMEEDHTAFEGATFLIIYLSWFARLFF